MSVLGSGDPLDVRLRVWSDDATAYFSLAEATGEALALGETPYHRALDVRTLWERIRRSWPGDEETVQSFGESLAAIVPDSIHAALQEAVGQALFQGSPLRVRFDCAQSTLSDLPWEWLLLRRGTPLDPAEGHLALVPNVRIARESQREAKIAADSDLRVLIVVADPASPRFQRLPWLASEARSIASTFASSRRGVELQTMFDSMPSSLERTLRDFRPHIVHFAGHGEVRPSGGVLVLRGAKANSERLLPGDVLASWLSDSGTQLAFLSACDTAGASGSVAQALVEGGVPTALAMQTPISDAAQPHFARVFYGSLLSGSSVDEAVAEARQAFGSSPGMWSSAVLYSFGAPLSLFAIRKDFSLRRCPNNLPRFSSPVVSRSREIEEVVRLCGESRLVVLVGPGGVGKTRLAVEAATLLMDTFPDGVWQVGCEACTTAESVLFAVARTLRVDHDERSIGERIDAHLAGRQILLVLDCLETVIAAGQQAVIERLLAGSSVSLLVTSRFHSGLQDEVVFEVLSLDGSREYGLDLLCQYAGFETSALTDDERRSLRNVCMMLEGVPLALVIAAGRLKFLEARQLETLLRESPLSTLGGRRSDISAAIRRSLDLLPESDLRTLRDFAVFAGSFTWEDVAEVYPDDRFELLEGLSHLADRSLLQAEGKEDHRRFRILDTLREYLDSLEESDDERLRQSAGREKHLKLFAERARSISTFMDEGRWGEGVQTLWDALPNFGVALDFAVRTDRYDETEVLCRSLTLILMEAGMWHDFERFAAAGHIVAVRADRPRLASYLLSLEGVRKSHLGDYKGAAEIWQQRLKLCRSIGNSVGASDALLDLATQAVGVGDADETKRWIDEAAIELDNVDRDDLRAVLATLRYRYYDMIGDRSRALIYSDEAEALLGKARYASQAIFIYTNLTKVWRQPSERPKVRNAMEKVLRDAFVGERRGQVALALTELGQVFVAEEQDEAATRCHAAVVSIFRELGSHRLREAERLFEEFRVGHPNVDVPSIVAQPWTVHVQAVLSHLTALAKEESEANP